MAAATILTKTEVFLVGASGVITLQMYAIAIKKAYIFSGSTTLTGPTTATITTATSSVINSLAFTGTNAVPSQTVTCSSSIGTGSLVFIEYVPAGAVPNSL